MPAGFQVFDPSGNVLTESSGGGVDTATTLAVGHFADHFFEQAQDDAGAA